MTTKIPKGKHCRLWKKHFEVIKVLLWPQVLLTPFTALQKGLLGRLVGTVNPVLKKVSI